MRRLLLGTVLSLVLATAAGCTLHTHPTSVEDLPGTERMAKSPGVLDWNSRYATDNGLTVYSSNPNQPSLVGPGQAAAPTAPAPRPPAAPAQSFSAPPAQPMSPEDYQRFSAFEAYQRFLALPADSPERVEFRQWLQWQYYLRWKARQGQ